MRIMTPAEASDRTQKYGLEYHPEGNPIPIGIWEMRYGIHFRCVAILKGDADATYEEALIMLKALRSAAE